MKRLPELRDLSDDHHTGLVLAKRCKEARPPHTLLWEQMLEAFSSHLEPHFQIEERHLLPALASIGEAALANRIREEHAALRALRDAPGPDGARLERFGALLESHIRYEEREVFETTQHRLPAEALEAIASACEAIPRACPAFLKS